MSDKKTTGTTLVLLETIHHAHSMVLFFFWHIQSDIYCVSDCVHLIIGMAQSLLGFKKTCLDLSVSIITLAGCWHYNSTIFIKSSSSTML